ncbi:MAG: Heteromeric decaprenylphosphoryl-beta-D-ribose 2'-epimerase subunit DprE2 [uncultured Nocardioidaceae bacterium]|uniref:Heteromeric decaprenylphosphoryl-beta-D-ribose 2'-epimerase subunit DprE2 n=1 Tax=uncultured Nocardioidaceae bacterium TaxID=253824 RepID=A0A6J4L255_9ACTN|nr:MAG: Heteromeric decaprenylphosphoryl-beta-D-ribose 2'-epimerase subunit DprE2 [uncultured Nocardioidaceae bacterium]
MTDALGTPRSVLLLGGTSDIALATARAWVSRGAEHITLAARPSERRSAAAAELQALGCTVCELDFDARAPRTHAGVVEAAACSRDVDVAVVAFGVLGAGDSAWTDVEAALEVAETNYVAAVSCGVALAALVRRQGHGVVVALSSVAGERARRSNFVYGSSKAGMDAFYTGLGDAVRDLGGRVLVVRPGFVHSRMTDALEAAPLAVTPEQVADVIVQGVARGAEQAWVPGQMRWVMSGLRHLPRPVFRRLPI